jgi:hypothetical protein
MLIRTLFRILEARGVDRYTLATWEARYVSRHHQAILEAIVIVVVFLLVLLLSGAASADQAVPAPKTGRPAAMGQMHRQPAPDAAPEATRCATHEATAADVAALRTVLQDAQVTNDVAMLRAAVDAALRHLDRMSAGAAACAAKMKPAEAPSVTPAPSPAPAPHVH